MPQSQMPYGDRTAAVRCQILQNRTAAVRSPYDFYGHRTVAVAFFTHRTMPLEVLTRSYNFSRHRTMFQPQTASYGRRTAAVRRPYGDRTVAAGLSLQRANISIVRLPYGHRTIMATSYGDRTVAVRWPYGRRRIILAKHKGIVRSPYGHRTVAVRSSYGGRAGNAE